MGSKRIAVVGSGLVGAASALALVRQGHAVTVLERDRAVAMQASFAAPGLRMAAQMQPFTALQRRLALAASLLGAQTAVRLKWRQPHGLGWLRPWLASARPSAHARVAQELLRRMQNHRSILQRWREEHQLNDQHHAGVWWLARHASDEQVARQHAMELAAQQEPALWCDAAALREREPLLNAQTPLRGALWWGRDESGNARWLAQQLLDIAVAQGAQLQLGCEVLGIEPAEVHRPVRLTLRQATDGQVPNSSFNGTPQSTWAGTAGSTLVADDAETATPATMSFDAVVLCSGALGMRLARQCGAPAAWLPLRLHALNVPLRNDELGPRAALVDASAQVGMVRLGNRLRLTGGLCLGGSGERPDAAAVEHLHRVLQLWFPGQTHTAQAQPWVGCFDMPWDALQGGLPLVGPSRASGVWFNLGYGQHAYALACDGAERLSEALG